MAVRKIREGIYSIGLAWGRAYVLVENGEAALIDTGLPKDRETLLGALRDLGVEDRIRTVYLTHAHCDHAGNAALFSRRRRGQTSAFPPGEASIALHREEAPYLSLPKRSYAPRGLHLLTRSHTAFLFAMSELLHPVERCGADQLLEDGDLVPAPGGPLRVVHCPGHTPGHIAFFRERDGILFSGDAVINIIPVKRVTGLSLPMRILTEDWEQAKQSARRLAELRPSLLLGGHGRPLEEEAAPRLLAWANAL